MACPFNHELHAQTSRYEQDAPSSSLLSDFDSCISTPSPLPLPSQRKEQSPSTSCQRCSFNQQTHLTSQQKLHATLQLWQQNNWSIKAFLKAWVREEPISGGFNTTHQIMALQQALEETEL